MGGGVCWKEESVHYAATESSEIAARWTPALGDGGCRYFGDFRDLAAFAKI